MKKTIIAIMATGFIGGIAFAPTPASAFIPFPLLYPIFQSKEDKNFHAVNPYEKKGGHKKSKKSR
jgi:hypothetical protein